MTSERFGDFEMALRVLVIDDVIRYSNEFIPDNRKFVYFLCSCLTNHCRKNDISRKTCIVLRIIYLRIANISSTEQLIDHLHSIIHFYE